ncbi:MAG: YdcF family protein [Patescibacteria group bacterium]
MLERLNVGNEKQKQVEALFHNKTPDAIFVPSADIKKAPEPRSGYVSPSYGDVDIRGLVSGGRVRTIAAAEAHKHFPNTFFVPLSRDRVDRGRPTHARVYADEMQKLGIPEERIILQEDPVNTITEIVAAVKLSVERGWRTIAFMSNDYQLDRIQAMYEHIIELYPEDAEFKKTLNAFKASGGTILCVSAEQLLSVRQPNLYGPLIRKAKGTLAYHVRELSESKGKRDILTGEYDVKKSKEV